MTLEERVKKLEDESEEVEAMMFKLVDIFNITKERLEELYVIMDSQKEHRTMFLALVEQTTELIKKLEGDFSPEKFKV